LLKKDIRLLEGNIFTKTLYPASYLVYRKLPPALLAKQKNHRSERNQTSAVARTREQARQCVFCTYTEFFHHYFLYSFHDIPFYWLFSVIGSILLSFCLPHGFNWSFSRHIIVIVTGLMDIFHNLWILFIFNFYLSNLFLNVNRYLCSRITYLESVTS
jgi:hypothetical protein